MKVRPLLRTAHQPKQRSQQHDRQARQQQPRSTANAAANSAEGASNIGADAHVISAADSVAGSARCQSDQQQPGQQFNPASQAVPGVDQSQSTVAGPLSNLSLQDSAAQGNAENSPDVCQQQVVNKQQRHVADMSSADHQQPQAQSQAQTQSTTPPHGQANSKGKKGRKTKKDYAAWAGATAESRAMARAHLDGNPDLEPTSALGRPTFVKQSKLCRHQYVGPAVLHPQHHFPGKKCVQLSLCCIRMLCGFVLAARSCILHLASCVPVCLPICCGFMQVLLRMCLGHSLVCRMARGALPWVEGELLSDMMAANAAWAIKTL